MVTSFEGPRPDEERAAKGLSLRDSSAPAGSASAAGALRLTGDAGPDGRVRGGAAGVAENMISTRRIVAAVGLAVSVTGLTAPLANAADTAAPDAGKLSPIATLDSLVLSDIPAEYKDEIPLASKQLAQLNRVNDLDELYQLHQVTDLAAPVTGLLPGIQY
jgi:hypothetical protein